MIIKKEITGQCELINRDKISCRYSLVISFVFFLESLTIAMIGWPTPDVLYVFGVMYPILFLLALSMLIFTVVTFRRRNKLDYIISVVLFLAALSILIRCVMYFYRARTGNFYYSLFYSFPWILKFNRHMLVSTEPVKYKLESTVTLFDPTLIVSLLCLIVSAIFNVTEKRKRRHC